MTFYDFAIKRTFDAMQVQKTEKWNIIATNLKTTGDSLLKETAVNGHKAKRHTNFWRNQKLYPKTCLVRS